MINNEEFPEIKQDSDDVNFNTLPVVSAKEEEAPTKIVDGYNTTEVNIINKVRGIRNELIQKLTGTGVPRGKELEMAVSLLNDQESSAHKTSTTRLRVKSEETKAVVSSAIMNFLFDERNKGVDILEAEAIDPLTIKLPEDFIPYDLVDQETSDIVKNNDLDVDDFMPTEREI